MDVQLVIGAGAIGTATAQLLAERGARVRLVTRSGAGPEHPAIERVAADASDTDALSRLAEGVAVIYSCAGPAYPILILSSPQRVRKNFKSDRYRASTVNDREVPTGQ